MTSKAKREARGMFTGAIRQLVENDYSRILNFNQLQRCLADAWNDLHDEGYLVAHEDKAENKR